MKVTRVLRPVGVLALVLVMGAGTTAASSGRGSHAPLAGAPDQAAADVLHVARNQLGDPYRLGATGPNAWDCSGLTGLWGTVGGSTRLPRTSAQQLAFAVPIPRGQLLKGDLVFFGAPATHVGLYAGGGVLLDASKSNGRVAHRPMWTSGVVRYGRAPRAGMPRVRPWAAPRAQPTPARIAPARPTSAPASGLRPLPGLARVQAAPSSRLAVKAAAGARSVAGRPGWDDVRLVRESWRHAGGALLPTDREALVRRGRTVALRDARVGDLVVYGRPARHLGTYLGGGTMVDASKTAGRVLVRPVYDAPPVRLVRLG